MHQRSLLSLFIIIIIILTLSVPVLAGNNTIFRHTITYEIDGLIDIERQVGDPCRTGAVKYQTISGEGSMTKREDVSIANHIMTIDEEADWITAPGALSNLIVTTTLDLCARPMSVAAVNYGPITRPTSIQMTPEEQAAFIPLENFFFDEEGNLLEIIDYLINQGDIINPYDPFFSMLIDDPLSLISKTNQIWAVYIETEPGHQGSYHADFIAAYGPGPLEEEGLVIEGVYVDTGEDLIPVRVFFGRDYRWWYRGSEIMTGDRYVGNYFDIEQFARTTGGEMRRFISMSSPLHNLYLTESMTVIGAAEVSEAFSMKNIEPGPDAITFVWWDLLF